LDSKAGILLGFAGVLVALSPAPGHFLNVLSSVFAISAGLAALAAFFPRKYQVPNVYALRRKYVSSDAAFTKLTLLDTHIRMLEATAELLHRKAHLVEASMSFLGLAVVLVGIGVGLD
jgi:hypothetical protein